MARRAIKIALERSNEGDEDRALCIAGLPS